MDETQLQALQTQLDRIEQKIDIVFGLLSETVNVSVSAAGDVLRILNERYVKT